MESSLFAELSVAGYVPLQTGYKKQLEEVERDMMEEMAFDLDLNDIN